MRMEAKNNYFKKIATASNNFVNIAFTVAKRHQHLLCSHLQSKKFFDQDFQYGPGMTILTAYQNECHFTLHAQLQKLYHFLPVIQFYKRKLMCQDVIHMFLGS